VFNNQSQIDPVQSTSSSHLPTSLRPTSTSRSKFNKKHQQSTSNSTDAPAAATSPITSNSTSPNPARPNRRSSTRPQRFVNNIFSSSSHTASTAINLDQDGNPLTYRSAINGPNASFWHTAEEEEIERLLDSNTIKFIPHYAKPKHRLSSYYNPQIKIKMKDGKPVYRVRGTYGGDRSDFEGETHARTANLPTIKILLDAVVSEDANWMTRIFISTQKWNDENT
jgi:hypothetical protein